MSTKTLQVRHGYFNSVVLLTVSPQREATWLITVGGLSSEFTSRSLCSENIFQMTGESGLWVKHCIHLSMFTYKPQLMREGGFSLRVAYQLNYVFRIQIRSLTYKLRGFLPGTYGIANSSIITSDQQENGWTMEIMIMSQEGSNKKKNSYTSSMRTKLQLVRVLRHKIGRSRGFMIIVPQLYLILCLSTFSTKL
mgnify:CR=1 FL=1